MVIFHILAIIMTGAVVIYSDEQGLMWVLGKKETLDRRRLEILHTIVGVGISLIILTGGLIALPRISRFIHDPVFIIKMGFVLVLIVNAFFVGQLMHTASEKSFASLKKKERLPLSISGAVSVIGWLGAITCGLLLG